MNRNYFIMLVFLLLISAFFISCNNSAEEPEQETKTIEQKSEMLSIPKDENKDRELWQKPETVVALLGDLQGKTVADIGAGTGYFTFRMALKAGKVIAIDIVPDYLEILDNLKNKLPVEIQEKIETRLASENDPKLNKAEADVIVIINTFSIINKKIEYLKTTQKGLKKNGKIFIIDFKLKNLPIDAPPIKDRLPINELEDYLGKAGFKNIVTDDTTLEYQYVVSAENI
ncbi:MAG: class I SAM-dependent methyltransferase [Deltaproteobacteria bacterium]